MRLRSLLTFQKHLKLSLAKWHLHHRPLSQTSWPLKSIPVACQEFLQDDIKPGGFTFNVTLVDTGRKPMGSTAIVVHDNPGDCSSLSSFISKLDNQGFRVIVPNLPGFGGTQGLHRSDSIHYNYSPAENAELLDCLLTLLDVNRPDVLVGMGAGCGPVILLATIMSTRFRSVCLVDPPAPLAANSPPPVPQLARIPAYLSFLLPRIWSSDMLRAGMLNRLQKYVDKASFPQLSVAHNWPEVVAASLITRENCDFELVHQRATVLGAYSSIPMALVTCKQSVTELDEVFNIDPSTWLELASVRNLESLPPDERKWTVRLAAGATASQQLECGDRAVDLFQDEEVAAILAGVVCRRVASLTESSAQQLCHSVG